MKYGSKSKTFETFCKRKDVYTRASTLQASPFRFQGVFPIFIESATKKSIVFHVGSLIARCNNSPLGYCRFFPLGFKNITINPTVR